MSDTFQFEIDFCRSILKRDGKDLDTLEMLAGYYTKAGRIDEGLELDRKLVRLDPDNAVSHYNLACSLALKKRSRAAMNALRKALEKGYRDFNWIMQDPDLSNLQEEPSFVALLSEFQLQK